MEKDFKKMAFPIIKAGKYGEYEKAYVPLFEIHYNGNQNTTYKETEQVYSITEAYQKINDTQTFKNSGLDLANNLIKLKYQEVTLDSTNSPIKKGDIITLDALEEQFQTNAEVRKLMNKLGGNDILDYTIHNPKLEQTLNSSTKEAGLMM